jgi:hypothetical protein
MDRSDAGQFLRAIDEHATCATGGMVACMAITQAAIMEGPDPLYSIQDVFVGVNFEGKGLECASFLPFLARDQQGDVPFFLAQCLLLILIIITI